MKFGKLFISILILIELVTICHTSFAKYVYDYTAKAAELNIDRTL